MESGLEVNIPTHPQLAAKTLKPRWNQDGTHILFIGTDVFYVIDILGSDLFEVEGYMPSFSPDGSRIAYTTDKYSTGWIWDRQYSYEVVTTSVAGTDTKRLTKDKHWNGMPSWSHDGAHIAFISDRDREGKEGLYDVYTITPDPSDVQFVVPGAELHTFRDFTWSPDSRHIAISQCRYVLRDRGENHEACFITVARADGSEFWRIFESESPISPLAWSPVDQRIAFLTTEGGSTVVYTIEADGSDAQPIFTSSKLTEYITSYVLDSRAVSWSPDGSEIRFLAYAPNFGLHSISADGTGLRTLQDGIYADSVGWSVNGSRIAVYRAPQGEESVVLYTSAPDGSDRRDLVRYVHGDIVAENSAWQDDYGPNCSSGEAVSNPKRNPDLVRDCEILLSVRDTLAGEGVDLNWRAYSSIESWEGIRVDGSPPRVEVLHLEGVRGTIPSELGDLSGLKWLFLTGNRLTGSIPPELGKLAELEQLLLSQNQLTGSIPPELGNLVNLEYMILDRNELVGDIPQELGNLENLKSLQLYANNLTACIPLTLSEQITLVNKPPDFCAQ